MSDPNEPRVKFWSSEVIHIFGGQLLIFWGLAVAFGMTWQKAALFSSTAKVSELVLGFVIGYLLGDDEETKP